MVIIKKRIKAYVLLESLIALGLLASIVSLVLGEVDKNRQQMAGRLYQQEVLNVATMAVQTKQDRLTLNGVSVRIERKEGQITVYENGRSVLQVEKN